MLHRMVLIMGALFLAGCQAAGPSASSDPLPKGTALPPPDFETEPGNEAVADGLGR